MNSNGEDLDKFYDEVSMCDGGCINDNTTKEEGREVGLIISQLF
ncbi:MAG TPA: hypothetical protein VNM69_00455 [Bacillus sp. (in: firmicutes)]|nr:hypothetical protein [Bacillus litorisediminis]HWO74366.1 hypothetical protein [Bacillus sp. (in: firmicutes)]